MTITEAREAIEQLQNNDYFRDFEVIKVHVKGLGETPEMYSGAFATTFHVVNKRTNHSHALRIWTKDVSGIKDRTKITSEYLSKHRSSYFVKYDYIPFSLQIGGNYVDVLLMDWISGKTLYNFIKDTIEDGNGREIFPDIAAKLKTMFRWLHRNKVVHGDLQHENIMIKENEVVLCDYDSIYVPTLKDNSQVTNGFPGYQHPIRSNGELNTCSFSDDYFSELILYSGLLILSVYPNLWNHAQSENYLIFTDQDFKDIASGKQCSTLDTILEIKAENKSDESIVKEISSLMHLLVQNLRCKNFEDIQPIPGINFTYCGICGHSVYSSFRYCPQCGVKLQHN